MSNLPDRPWTEEEKYFLLAEILKKHSVPHSYLVRIVHEFRIAPNWGDIPLPSGRSLNSCKVAFDTMLAQTPSQHPAMPSPSVQMPRPDARTPGPVDPNMRKRTLYPADKPRAIQPRPPPSVASYSSESGASTQLSPRLEGPGEPPRKRGRPSKAETERRRAAAEARGETYPPPRRPGSARMKITPSPTSPPGPPPPGPPLQPYTYQQHQVHGPNPGSMPFDPVMGAGRHIAPVPSLPRASEERHDMAARGMGPTNPRALPRPQEMTLPMPSHGPALQLGPPSSFPPRLNNEPVERSPFGPVPPDRFSPDSGRRDSVTSRGEPPPPHGPYSEGRASITPGEKPR